MSSSITSNQPKHLADLDSRCNGDPECPSAPTETVLPHLFEKTGTRRVIEMCDHHAGMFGDERLYVYAAAGTEHNHYVARAPKYRAQPPALALVPDQDDSAVDVQGVAV